MPINMGHYTAFVISTFAFIQMPIVLCAEIQRPLSRS